jgi:hypothetical protein
MTQKEPGRSRRRVPDPQPGDRRASNEQPSLFTQQQRQELNEPEPRACEPLTNETYVRVRAEVYEHLKAVLDEDWA